MLLVDFNGDIVIHGNVEAGVVINAGKSLTVDGVVESASITAGGMVCLKRGMQGGGKGSITAGGDIFTEFWSTPKWMRVAAYNRMLF